MPQKILPVSESTMRGEIDCRFSEAPIAAPTRFAARCKAWCVCVVRGVMRAMLGVSHMVHDAVQYSERDIWIRDD